MAVNLSYGSNGADVKKLQKSLSELGYSLTVDGNYGAATTAAVKDYQKRTGLTSDGVADIKTLASLGLSFSQRPQFTKSNELVAAENKLSEWENSRPGEYSSKYSDRINELLGNVLNRRKFSYNMNADPLFRQYREQYIENGKKAMMDTVGQASALTGGYANSYAVTAGSEAYHEYLGGLNDIALELYDRALKAYEREGDAFLEDIELLRDLDGEDYDRYLNSLKAYYDDGDYLFKKISAMNDDEYKAFVQELDSWESDRDFNYKVESDRIEREQTLKKLEAEQAEKERSAAFKEAEAKRDQANKDREYALALAKLSASSSGSSKSSSGSSKSSSNSSTKKKTSSTLKSTSDKAPKTYSEFCKKTGYSGIMTESEFGRSTSTKKKYKTYTEYLSKMYEQYKDQG